MSLKSKRAKELRRLRASAEDLWRDQQVLLQKANVVAREAGRQAGNYTREEVAPRLRDGYEQYVRPRVDDARDLARYAGERIERRVIPAVGTALGTALSVVDVAKDARGKAAAVRRGAIDRVGAVRRVTAVRATRATRRGHRGRTLALCFAAATLTGLAYAVWQTFRADDELWVSEETPAAPSRPTPPATPSAPPTGDDAGKDSSADGGTDTHDA
ncbi:MAG TPA: hypothetical protein VFQ96_00035 [Microbacteriaceae bacterium]|nr:hypothetical protein [Microbacteriaceae bacterium]